MKGSGVFLIAVIDRNRFTSRVSGAVIGGLVGAGFAFSENIVYYARTIVYGSTTSGAGDVDAALHQMVVMRGIQTCFGHPLFTMMTGLGVAFAVTSRSKIVRVVAPVAGYLSAAFLHMFFNTFVSALDDNTVTPAMLIVVWPIVIMVGIRLALSAIRQGRTVAARLQDYVVMGWLPASYPPAFARLRTRAWTIVMSLWHANVIKTWKLQVRVTRLALLREAITRGTVDAAAVPAERELLTEIGRLAQGGLLNGTGLRPYWPWQAARRRLGLVGPEPRGTVPLIPAGKPSLSYAVLDSPSGRPNG
jgi:hypothetical protein